MEKSARDQLSAHILKHYASQNKFCSLGWTAFQAGMSVNATMDDPKIRELVRDAFYMGIQHLFSSLLQTLGDDVDAPETGDFLVMASTGQELHEFLVEFLERNRIFASGMNAAIMPEPKEPPKENV